MLQVASSRSLYEVAADARLDCRGGIVDFKFKVLARYCTIQRAACGALAFETATRSKFHSTDLDAEMWRIDWLAGRNGNADLTYINI